MPDEYDFSAREQNNSQGRWISPDPVRGTGNKYVYANNNPLSNVDAYGLETYSLTINGFDAGDVTEGETGEPYEFQLEAESRASQNQQTSAQPSANPPAGNTVSGTATTSNQQRALAANAQDLGQPAAQQQAPPADQKLTNVVYNELGSGRADPKAKPSAPGSADDLANGRQAVAEIAYRVMDAGHPNCVAPSDLNDDAAVKTDAYAKSRVAADAALNGSNISNGATQYRTRVNGDITTPVGKSSTNPGTPVSQHYGPFIEGNHTFVIVVAQ